MALPVKVVRSPRRRKTVQAREHDGRLEVMIPAWMSDEDEHRWVEEMTRRFAEHDGGDLTARGRRLAATYRLPEPATVTWSSRQGRRWGSCTPATSGIRVSDRLRDAPEWVLDYVLLHELAHLVVADHGPEFRALIAGYPRAERALGFLEAWNLSG